MAGGAIDLAVERGPPAPRSISWSEAGTRRSHACLPRDRSRRGRRRAVARARERRASLRTLAARAWSWRDRGYDLAINFEGDIRSHALMALSGAPVRVGFDMAGGGPLLTRRVAFRPDRHIVSQRGRAGRGGTGRDVPGHRRRRSRLDLPPAARERARALVGSRGTARRPAPERRPCDQAVGSRSLRGRWQPHRARARRRTRAHRLAGRSRDHGAVRAHAAASGCARHRSHRRGLARHARRRSWRAARCSSRATPDRCTSRPRAAHRSSRSSDRPCPLAMRR